MCFGAVAPTHSARASTPACIVGRQGVGPDSVRRGRQLSAQGLGCERLFCLRVAVLACFVVSVAER
eukprot:11161142-Lingulodinium_polyedra.AAC.1